MKDQMCDVRCEICVSRVLIMNYYKGIFQL